MHIRIYYEDTDAGGIVYHANYLKYCERARSEIFFRRDIKAFNPDSHFVVTKIEAKYLKPAKLGDIIEVKTSLIKLKKASALLNQEIYKIDGIDGQSSPQLLFSAQICVAYLKDGKPAKIDEELLSVFD